MKRWQYLSILLALAVAIGAASVDAREKTIIDIVLDDKKTKKRQKLQKRRAVMRSEIYFAAVEKKLIKGINRTIKYLNSTLRSLPPKSSARHGIYEKLMNLYVEQASYISSTEYRRFDQRWKKWSVRRRGSEPRLNDSKSRRVWQKVGDVSGQALQEFPKSKRGDVLLFSRAISFMFLNKLQQASATFEKIIKEYPNSNFAGDSYFALGDFYFDRSEFSVALKYYDSATKYQRSKRYGWSLFKKAWCYYNTGKYSKALATWKKTVQYSRREQNKNTLRLREEALRDMIYAFAELKMLDQAITYYKINGTKENISDTVMTFASISIAHGKFREAIRAYRKFLTITPWHPKAAEIRRDMVGLYYETGNKKAMWQELEQMPRKYGKGSAWARRNASDRELIAEAQKMAKERVLYYAKLAHVTAQKRKNDKAMLAEAARGYRAYLRNYSTTPEALEVKFLLGDVFYLQKKYRASAQSYTKIVMLNPKRAVVVSKVKGKSKNLHAQAARYMLEAHFLDFKPEFTRILKLKPKPERPPRPLSAKARSFVKACRLYLKWYSKNKKKKKECGVHIAEIYYRLNHKNESKKYLLALAMAYPGTKEGESAVDNLIPFYKADKLALVGLLKKLMAVPAYGKGKMGKKLNKLYWGMKVEEVSSLKGTSQKARRYEKLVQQRPNIEDADKLLFNAAASYVNAGDYNSAVRVYSKLIKNYPRSVHVSESILKLASIYDRNMQFKAAARYYLQFATRSKAGEGRNAALTRACELKIVAYDRTLLSTCARLVAIDVKNYKIIMQRLLKILSLEKNYNTLTTLVKKYYLGKVPLTPNERIIALYYLHRATRGRGPYGRQITATFRQSRGAVSGEALKYVGEVVFASVDGALARFQRLKLRGGMVNAMQSSIKHKYNELNRLEGQYDLVVVTRDSYWGVAAFHQKGVAYSSFAKMLENPPSIKGAKLTDVKKQLLPQARALRAKALEYFTSAQKVARKFQVLNPWVAKINSQVGMLSGRSRNFREWTVEPDFIAYEVNRALQGQIR